MLVSQLKRFISILPCVSHVKERGIHDQSNIEHSYVFVTVSIIVIAISYIGIPVSLL